MKERWFILVLTGCAAHLADGRDERQDAAPSDVAIPDADDASLQREPDAPSAPVVATFPVGVECNGGHCTGGYENQLNAAGPPTADHVCTTHAFPRATSYTISSKQPGGRFCTYDPTAQQFGCDSDCSGCNAIDSVTCSTP